MFCFFFLQKYSKFHPTASTRETGPGLLGFLTLGVAGYVSFGTATQGDFLLNYKNGRLGESSLTEKMQRMTSYP